MDDFDKKIDDLANNYEKGVGKLAPKLGNAVGKVAGAANHVYNGCILIFANLFFAGFCLWGAYAGYISWKLQNEGVTTSGTVVRMEESSNNDGGCCVYSPVIEFNATDDRTYSFESDNASYPPAYEVGEEVNVLYDPADPNTAQINKWTERWLFPIIIIPGMIFSALILNFFMIRAWMRGESLDDV